MMLFRPFPTLIVGMLIGYFALPALVKVVRR
jgi:hypothetical protein